MTKPRSSGATTTRTPGVRVGRRAADRGERRPRRPRTADQPLGAPALGRRAQGHRVARRPTSSPSWSASRPPSPATGSNARTRHRRRRRAPRRTRGDARARRRRAWPSSRSKGRCRRGNARAVGRVRRHAPGGGQGLGQGVLLVEQLDGPVPDAARLDQHDLGVGGQQVGEQLLVGRSHGSQRLHAVEDLALGQPLPLGPAPRLGRRPGRPPGPGPRRSGRSSRHPKIDRPVEVGRPSAGRRRRTRSAGRPRRPRGRCAPAASAVDGNTSTIPPRTASSPRCSTWYSRRYPAPTRAPTSRPRRRGAPRRRPRAGDAASRHGAEPLQQGPDRGDHHRRGGRPGLAEEVPQDAEAPAHGLHVGADPLEGQGLPGREEHDRLGAGRPAGAPSTHGPGGGEEAGQVVGQALGVGRRGRDHHERARGRERPGRPDVGLGRPGTARLASPRSPGQGRLATQQRRQRRQPAWGRPTGPGRAGPPS